MCNTPYPLSLYSSIFRSIRDYIGFLNNNIFDREGRIQISAIDWISDFFSISVRRQRGQRVGHHDREELSRSAKICHSWWSHLAGNYRWSVGLTSLMLAITKKNFWKNNSPFVNLNGLASQWFWLFPVINKIIIIHLVSICRYSKVVLHSLLKLKIIIKNCFAFRVARFKHYVARKIFFRSFAGFVQWLSHTEVNKTAKLYIFRRYKR